MELIYDTTLPPENVRFAKTGLYFAEWDEPGKCPDTVPNRGFLVKAEYGNAERNYWFNVEDGVELRFLPRKVWPVIIRATTSVQQKVGG